jgi:hypothetical protein
VISSSCGFGLLDAATMLSAQRWLGAVSYGGFVIRFSLSALACLDGQQNTELSRLYLLTMKRFA